MATVNVTLLGVLRLKTGISKLALPAARVCDLYPQIAASASAADSEAAGRREPIEAKKLKDCIVMVNGRKAGPRTPLKDGDEVVLLSPAGGG